MFELWDSSECIAIRNMFEVKEEFHSMKIGETRILKDEIWIMRIK